jgi:hypothetical protein
LKDVANPANPNIEVNQIPDFYNYTPIEVLESSCSGLYIHKMNEITRAKLCFICPLPWSTHSDITITHGNFLSVPTTIIFNNQNNNL